MKKYNYGDLEFDQYYEGCERAPRWFVVLCSVFFMSLKVAVLYGIAKLVSIEAALIVYVIIFGIVRGLDDYTEERNFKMLLWNDKRLNSRLDTLGQDK